MKHAKYHISIGFGLGALFSFTAATVTVFLIRDHGISQDAIANFLGAGFGAAATVLGVHVLESGKRSAAASVQAQLLMTELYNVDAILCTCEIAADLIDKGSSTSAVDEARINTAIDKFDRVLKESSAMLPETIWTGVVVKDSIRYFIDDLHRRQDVRSPLAALMLPSLRANLNIGRSALERLKDICQSYI